MKTESTALSFGGTQGVYSHSSSECNCDMTFAVYMPPQAADGPVPVLWYLSGLTCTHANVMDKGEYRAHAAKHGVAVVCPDTSPRSDNVPDEADNWQFGSGAGFYLDAQNEPWRKNYRMYSYIRNELQKLVLQNFNVDADRQGIFGHSMGGHGALTMALKNPDLYKSCSAFAPIVQPTTADWSSGAFERYLGDNPEAWADYDATLLVENGARLNDVLIDQGAADGFLEDGLRPWLFEKACQDAGIPLTLRMQEGYDHSYFFISTFMEDHITWHAERL
ncbi:MAG: S-formylglutathione hydrolase [Rhizobiaceae bacterium]|nr:S-formylglutathione hydrolase [Hyphomicrobiales bacterium]NRB32394.1 S-formylglutathione hydrolase [Rhizobiaceae bacterium]